MTGIDVLYSILIDSLPIAYDIIAAHGQLIDVNPREYIINNAERGSDEISEEYINFNDEKHITKYTRSVGIALLLLFNQQHIHICMYK